MKKDCEYDSLQAVGVGKDSHRSGSSSHFSECPFDQVGGSKPAPEILLFDLEEGKELIDIFLETGDGPGISLSPI